MDLKILKQVFSLPSNKNDPKAFSIVKNISNYIERIDKLGWRLFRYVKKKMHIYHPSNISSYLFCLTRHPTKTVAAINGHAIAGGTFIAAACDIRISISDNKILFGLNEIANGFFIPFRMLLVCQNAFVSTAIAQQVCLFIYFFFT